MKLYEGGKQNNSKADLLEAVETTMFKIEPAEVEKLSKSTDNRLLAVIKKSYYIKM